MANGLRFLVYNLSLNFVCIWASQADEGILLQEVASSSQARHVKMAFSAEGSRPLPVDPPSRGAGSPRAVDTKPQSETLPFRFSSKQEWVERIRSVDEGGKPQRSLRRIQAAEGTIDFFRGLGHTLATRLRPELSLLIAERGPTGVVIVSAGGSFTRDELDLVQSPADPLILGELLPSNPVSVASVWDVPAQAALSLSEYQSLTSSRMKATLASCDEQTAQIRLEGELKGSIHGSEGVITINGVALFDRKARLITKLTLDRAEVRQAGPVESALDVKSRLELEQSITNLTPELSDQVLEGLDLDVTPMREKLRLNAPEGLYSLSHDRSWHLVEDNASRVILKRLDASGRTVAQCNLMVGPRAGRGRHQDLAQFQADVQAAIGERFGQFLGSGEIENDNARGFRYKLSVEGVEQAAGVVPLWYYYLVASPAGDQIIVIFTLSRGSATQFGDQDLQLIGSLEWNTSRAKQP